MCVSIAGVIPLALWDFAVGRLTFVIDGCFLAFDGRSLLAAIGFSSLGRCGSCPIYPSFAQESFLVDGQHVLQHTNCATWSVCSLYQLRKCRLIHRFRTVCNYNAW